MPRAKTRTKAKTRIRKLAHIPPTLLPIGHGSYVTTNKLIAILNSNSSPVKRLVHQAKKAKTLKDATHGRKARSVLIMENGDIIASALNTDTMAQRFDSNGNP